MNTRAARIGLVLLFRVEMLWLVNLVPLLMLERI